jgi:hypothetical protein
VREHTTEERAAPPRRARRRPAKQATAPSIDDIIDESLKESFPASDPPSWVAGTRVGAPKSIVNIQARIETT